MQPQRPPAVLVIAILSLIGGVIGMAPAHVTLPSTAPAVSLSNCADASAGGSAGGAGAGGSTSHPAATAATRKRFGMPWPWV